ncbi:hypothetical protein HID58_056120, partial [Brassica napus]
MWKIRVRIIRLWKQYSTAGGLTIEMVVVNCNLEEPAAILLALKNLVGKTYFFKVGIKRENFLYSHDTYKVTKIITNDEIISEFDTKVYPKLPNLTYTGDNTVLSDAP